MDAIKFYDTNAILNNVSNLTDERFYISSETLRELEEIKSSSRKDDQVKYAARNAIRMLNENEDKYQVILYDNDIRIILSNHMLEDTPDNRICACAYKCARYEPIIFVTDDLCCKTIAKGIFNLQTESIKENVNELTYTGFVEVTPSDEELAYFYEHQKENMYNLLINQYIILRNKNGDVVDVYRWNGETYQILFKKQIRSSYFDKLKPKDVYQSLAIDSIMNNTITAITGAAGSGKSLMSLCSAMYLIENGKYDSIVILYNPTKTKGAFDQGFYSGSAIEKGMQQFIGHMLSTKFGDQFGVELLMQQGKIKLVSLADCRGMEVRDNEILYISESQNTTVDLIKLALSRASAGAKVIIEGDYKAQTDSFLFDGENNGLRRTIEAFRGHEEFGYVDLQNVWRSKLAQLAELL